MCLLFSVEKSHTMVGISFFSYTMANPRHLNNELLRLMREQNLTVYELAKRMNISPSTLYRVQRGTTTLRDETFLRILQEGFPFTHHRVQDIFLKALCQKYL